MSSDLATAEPQRAPAKRERAPNGRVSPRIAKAIRLLESGECRSQNAAAARANISASALSEALQKPHVQAFIARRRRSNIAVASIRASHRIAELIDASSEHVSLDASKHVLAIEGVRPSEDAKIVNNINVMAGYVIDLSPTLSPARDTLTDVDLSQNAGGQGGAVIEHEPGEGGG